MRVFIDSSDADRWEQCCRLGWAYGATTNPLILKREGKSCDFATYRELVAAAKGSGLRELQIQTTGSTVTELAGTGEEIARLWDQMVVKVPLTQAGLEAAALLIKNNIRVTLTAAYAAHQMIAACALGASYIAPYYGRLLDAGEPADLILEAMAKMRGSSPAAPRILVASIRTIEQLEKLAANGHDTFTISPALAGQLALNAMTERAAGEFEAARAKP